MMNGIKNDSYNSSSVVNGKKSNNTRVIIWEVKWLCVIVNY